MVAVLTLTAPFLEVCNATSPEKEGAMPSVGVLVYQQNNPFLALVVDAIKATLEGKVNVEVFYAESDQTTQNEQLAHLLAEKVDGIILNIVTSSATEHLLDAIKKANIPVVFFHREPTLKTLKHYPKARYVGTTVADAGTLQGDIIKELWEQHPEYDRNKDGKFQYVMIQSSLDSHESLARTIHSIKRARENGVAMQQVGETLFCSWDEEAAYEAMQRLYPVVSDSVECIIANNDTMALGAIRALNIFGYNREGGRPDKFFPVIGVDAIKPAIDAIEKGVMSASVTQDDEAIGFAAATILLNMLDKKDELAGLPFSWDKSGIAVRIPYSKYVISPLSTGQGPQ